MGRYDLLTTLEDSPKKDAPAPAAPSPTPEKAPAPRTKNKRRDEQPSPPSPPSASDTMTPRYPDTTPPQPDKQGQDTSLLTSKEKTKYGTYLTDESIAKINIRAIQLKRDAHQIVQEAVNQYFERLEK
jgi:hypothetical protein